LPSPRRGGASRRCRRCAGRTSRGRTGRLVALLRQHAPLPVRDDIVVGLDEATRAGMPEPIAASHRTLGRLLTAARSGPGAASSKGVLDAALLEEFGATTAAVAQRESLSAERRVAWAPAR
jgi:hypothetical protein